MPPCPLNPGVRNVDHAPVSPIFSCGNSNSINGPARSRQPVFTRLRELESNNCSINLNAFLGSYLKVYF
ncbi:MAG: hypothetical protein D3904_13325, partial [Candidatus Electrothrix sp. EH2]|nr:hypothetical protein [Candidatus Electrothrix sp. EH2]